MGFGLAAAAAIVATTLAVSGYAITGAILDTEAALRDARAAAADRDAQALHSTVTIDDVSWSADHVTITATNSGSVAIDAAHLDVLLDGQLFTGQQTSVDGYAGTLWPPLAAVTIEFAPPDLGATYSAVGPDVATLVTSTGSMAFWSA